MNEIDIEVANYCLSRQWFSGPQVQYLGAMASQQQLTFLAYLEQSQSLNASQLGELRWVAQKSMQAAASAVNAPTAPLSAANLLNQTTPATQNDSHQPVDSGFGTTPVPSAIPVPQSQTPSSSHNSSACPSTPSSPSTSSSSGASQLSVGDEFGPFEILGELGRGGMGVVFKARKKDTQQICALKVLIAGLDASAEVLGRFRAEAEIASAMSEHENIVTVLDSGQIGAVTYMAMEFIDGTALSTLLKAEKVNERAGARVVEDMASAVQFAHEQNVIHRDIKPQNILIDRNSTAKLADFGCAKFEDSGSTMTGAVVGTLNYMSPEQAENAKTVTTAADVYALGAILYHVLTGRPPHIGVTSTNILTSLATKTPPRPKELNPDCDPELEKICLKAIHRNPKKRFKTARSLGRAIHQWRKGLTVQSVNIDRGNNNSSKILIIVAIVSVFVVAAGAMVLFGNSPNTGSSSKDPAQTPDPKIKGTPAKSIQSEKLKLLEIIPATNSFVRTTQITIKGTVSPEVSAVKVNLLTIQVQNGQFALPIQLRPGSNAIKIELQGKDPSEDPTSEQSIHEVEYQINSDTAAPTINLDEYLTTTDAETITLTGSISDDSPVTLKTNQVETDLDSSRFRLVLPLKIGSNNFNLEVTDKAGNSAKSTIVVSRRAKDTAVDNQSIDSPPKKPDIQIETDDKNNDYKDNNYNDSPQPSSSKPISLNVQITDNNEKLLGPVFSLSVTSNLKLQSIQLDSQVISAKQHAQVHEHFSYVFQVKLTKSEPPVKWVAIALDGQQQKLSPQFKFDLAPPVLKQLKLKKTRSSLVLEYQVNEELKLANWQSGATIEAAKVDNKLKIRARYKPHDLINGLSLTVIDKVGNKLTQSILPQCPILHDRDWWSEFTKKSSALQNEIQRVADKHAANLEYIGTSSYKIHSYKHTIASFKHKFSTTVFQLIPGGQGLLGSAQKNAPSPEVPQIVTNIKPFFLARNEMSYREYERILPDSDGDRVPKNKLFVTKDDLTFRHCRKILSKFRKAGDPLVRLPSEAEWEYACRAGTTTPYFCGTRRSDDYIVRGMKVGYDKIAIDKSPIKPNAFGLYDMLSNHEEWVADHWFPSHKRHPGTPAPRYSDSASVSEPLEYEGLGVLRGGSMLQTHNSDDAVTSSARRSLSRGKVKKDEVQRVTVRLARSVFED